MSKQSAQVDAAAARTIELAERFAKTVAPNEIVDEYDHGKVQKILCSVAEVIKSSNRENLIANLNAVISKLGLPDFEHDVASRGILVAKLQGLEIVTSIQKLQSAARAAGYIDPDIPNIDLNSKVSQEFIGDVRSDLEEVRSLIEKLDDKLNKSGKSGISVSFGGLVSVDLSVLIGLVKATTEDALNYINLNENVSAELLRNKLKDVSQTSQNIMEGIRQKVSFFGSRIVALSSKLARAAVQSYMSGLQLLKNNIDNHIEEHPDVPAVDNTHVNAEKIIEKLEDVTKARDIIENLIAGYKAGKFGGGRQNLTGQLINVRFLDGNSGIHAVLIIAARVAGGTYRLTLPISREMHSYLSSLGNNTLDLAAYRAFEATKDNS